MRYGFIKRIKQTQQIKPVRRVIVKGASLLCLAALPALAAAAPMDVLRNMLSSGPTGQLMASSYIKGSVDTWAAMGAICPPANMKVDATENVVLTYMAIHPNDQHTLPEIVRAAFLPNYRCAGRK